MKISLITTVRNEERSIRELANAIRSQSLAPDEWIVVDGGSKDQTVEILKKENDCKLIIEEGNISQGRNRAVAESKGDIIAVTDAGALPDSDWLKFLAAPLKAQNADFSAGPSEAHITKPLEAAQWIVLDQFYKPQSSWRGPTISSRSLAFFRKIWEDCPYPEWLDIGEDRWLVDQWMEQGGELVWTPEAKIIWSLRPNFSEILKQHFKYMRGDGQAKLRTKTNWARIAFYSLLILLLFPFWPQPVSIVTALTLWAVYFFATLAARFSLATREQSYVFRMKTLAITPLVLLGADLAKVLGFLVGGAERLLKGRPGQ